MNLKKWLLKRWNVQDFIAFHLKNEKVEQNLQTSIDKVWIRGNEVLALHLKHRANGRPVGWSIICDVKNYSVLKQIGSHYLWRRARLHSRTVCFNTHIRKSVFNIYGCVGKLVTPVDCKSAAPGTAGSTPAASTIYAPLAQLGERDTVTVEVRGSKPLRGAKLNGSVVQSGRTLVSKTKCRWFKSILGRQVMWSVRLSVRTLGFHPKKRGSIPLRSSKLCTRGREAQCNWLQTSKTAGSNPAVCSKLQMAKSSNVVRMAGRRRAPVGNNSTNLE